MGKGLILINAARLNGVENPPYQNRRGRMQGVQGTYNDKVVRQFTVMTVVWGIVGMLVGC
jgi:Cbb3-type cytochrome oxidase, subunit 1